MNHYLTLSQKYRTKNFFKLDEEEFAAYIEARMPATRAAISYVLAELKKRINVPINTLLDLGAGPGTGFLAAQELFPELKKALLIEQESKMIDLGKNLIETSTQVEWVQEDMRIAEWDRVDLALFGYSFGELKVEDCLNVLDRTWKNCSFLAIVEPGTPRGFERIQLAREWILRHGGFLLAPCPHQNACPIKDGDWCHFSKRLERSKQHRKMKNGVLGWEDEKFSYLIASHEMHTQAYARVIRHPIKKSGHVALTLCTQNGLTQKILSRKQKDLYQFARKIQWGDGLSSEQIIEKTKNSSADKAMDKSPDSSNNCSKKRRMVSDIN